MGKTLAEKLYSIIEEKIVKLEFKPGTFLTESFLEKDLKCGRTPIREAIQRLSREGLVKVLPRKGLLVTEININDQLNLIQVRREIERLMAKLSAKNSSFSQKKKFKEISLSMRSCKKTDNTKFIKLDREMNELLSQSCDNEFVRRSIRIVGGLSRRFWFYRNKGILDDLPTMAKLHSKVCDAISDGNIKLAQQQSDNLMDYIEKFTKDSVQL
jgi:DNA-binding GntR family transcriptional regulator